MYIRKPHKLTSMELVKCLNDVETFQDDYSKMNQEIMKDSFWQKYQDFTLADSTIGNIDLTATSDPSTVAFIQNTGATGFYSHLYAWGANPAYSIRDLKWRDTSNPGLGLKAIKFSNGILNKKDTETGVIQYETLVHMRNKMGEVSCNAEGEEEKEVDFPYSFAFLYWESIGSIYSTPVFIGSNY